MCALSVTGAEGETAEDPIGAILTHGAASPGGRARNPGNAGVQRGIILKALARAEPITAASPFHAGEVCGTHAMADAAA